MRHENIKDRKDTPFKRLTGVPYQLFSRIVAVLKKETSNFGRPATLSLEDELLMTLMYWREYRTQFHIGETYQLSESTVCRTINKIENLLIQSGQFILPGKKKLQESDTLIEIILVDAKEQAIERPKKTENALQRQEKMPHSKAQVIVDQKTLEIIATAFCNGKKHDFFSFP
jgi:hypothetical protein